MPALNGLTVLDLNRRYPGALATMFLADFGARVIKIDPPGSNFPIPDIDTSTAEFAAHFALDRNKQSIELNLKSDEGREVFYTLCRQADVLVEGYRPGVMQRLKADYPTLKEMNPRLVYCSVTGFGQDGPYSQLPGHDENYCAIGGALSLIGPKDGPPYFASNMLADVGGAGMHAAVGILIALMARERTGEGQFVDVSYLDSVISLLAYDASYYLLDGKVPLRGETVNTGGTAWANNYKCSDGEYFTVACLEPHFWANLCRAIGRDDLIPYQNPSPEKKAEIIDTLSRIFLGKTRDEWFEFFKDFDVCTGPVYHMDETFRDPQVVHRQMVVDVEDPVLGRVRQLGIPIKLSATPGEIRRLGVTVGTDTEEVLVELGYSQGDATRSCGGAAEGRASS